MILQDAKSARQIVRDARHKVIVSLFYIEILCVLLKDSYLDNAKRRLAQLTF
jgi:hypothetical protein